MSKRSKAKRTNTQRLLWLLSLFMVGSMVISLIIVAFPEAPQPTETPWPTQERALPSPTLPTQPTSTSLPPAPTATSVPTATEPAAGREAPPEAPTATQPVMGPVLPSATPAVTPTTTLPPAATTTPSAASPAFSFAVCGDSRDNPEVYGKLLLAVAEDGSEFLIHTGDLVNTGTEEQWQEFKQSMAGFPLPFYPLPGNHDALGGTLNGFLTYSGAPARHYSFDWGAVHFALADSHNGGVNQAELVWLRGDLSATPQPLKMVFLHHPPFDPDGSDHVMAFGNREFMALMDEMDVDYVMAGHIHAYAREERGGVTYLYTGGGGAPVYATAHPQAFHHYLHVSVEGDQVTIELVKL